MGKELDNDRPFPDMGDVIMPVTTKPDFCLLRGKSFCGGSEGRKELIFRECMKRFVLGLVFF